MQGKLRAIVQPQDIGGNAAQQCLEENETTYLLMRREHGEPRSGRLVLVWCTQSPEGNRTTAELGKPALKFGLSRVVWQSTHV